MSAEEEEVPWWRAHLVPFTVALAILLALLGWLTAQQGSPRWGLLAYVAGLAVAYGIVQWAPILGDDRENLTFLVTVLGLLGLLGVLSGWRTSYLVFIAITILIFALFSLGLNLEYGHTGIINFGHVAFMGIGAYTTVLLSRIWVPSADALTTSTLLGAAVLGAGALAVFVLAAVLGTVAAEVSLERFRDRLDPSAHRRITLAAGALLGVLSAGILVGALTSVSIQGSLPFLHAELAISSSAAGAFAILGTVLVGMVGAAIAGVLLGLPTLRLREDYLAIVTIGFAEILRRFWLNEAWLTQGTKGIADVPLPYRAVVDDWAWLSNLAAFLGTGSAYKLFLLLLVAGALLLVYALYEILVRAPYGRVLKAIREDEEVAAALGKNVFAYKLQALALGSAVAALAGSLLAWHRVYISPSTFLPLFTFYAWIIIVVGGIGNNKGTILGALFLYTIFEGTRFLGLEAAFGITSSQAAAFRVLLIGILLIAFMMFKPEGILGEREEMVLGD